VHGWKALATRARRVQPARPVRRNWLHVASPCAEGLGFFGLCLCWTGDHRTGQAGDQPTCGRLKIFTIATGAVAAPGDKELEGGEPPATYVHFFFLNTQIHVVRWVINAANFSNSCPGARTCLLDNLGRGAPTVAKLAFTCRMSASSTTGES